MGRRSIEPGDGNSRHGTYNGYQNYGCRCDACRAANTAYYASKPYQAKYRDRLTAEGFQRGQPGIRRKGKHPYGPNKSIRHDA
jgi:hypothetical protein